MPKITEAEVDYMTASRNLEAAAVDFYNASKNAVHLPSLTHEANSEAAWFAWVLEKALRALLHAREGTEMSMETHNAYIDATLACLHAKVAEGRAQVAGDDDFDKLARKE